MVLAADGVSCVNNIVALMIFFTIGLTVTIPKLDKRVGKHQIWKKGIKKGAISAF